MAIAIERLFLAGDDVPEANALAAAGDQCLAVARIRKISRVARRAANEDEGIHREIRPDVDDGIAEFMRELGACRFIDANDLIATFDGKVERAATGDAVTLTFADEIDVTRGDLLTSPKSRAEFADQFAAHLIWMKEEQLVPGRSYWLKLGTRTVPATVTALKHRIDVDNGAHVAARTLALNEIGFCNLSTTQPIAFDPYTTNRDTGGFILIDRFTNETAAAGMILDVMVKYRTTPPSPFAPLAPFRHFCDTPDRLRR